MFLLKKIITPFILPPGIFITILFLISLWFILRRQWQVGFLNIFVGILIWFFSISPVADTLIRGLEKDVNIPSDIRGDVIILLGGGSFGEALDFSGIGAPSEETVGRIVTAVRLQKKINVAVIVSGGAGFKGRKAESPILKRFLIDLGVPADKIIIEDKSRDTIENAKYTKEICEKYNFKKPILVTSAYHMKRSIMSFEKVGMKVIPFPAYFKTWKNKKYIWEDYLPDASDFKRASMALREYIGIWYYKIAY
jgi:uncharacterized SAM-binding protein YcdF (DUF218 family)